MTTEEAIQHCEEVAAGKTKQGKCPECEADHKQLAEWLRELVALRAQQKSTLDRSRWEGCPFCRGKEDDGNDENHIARRRYCDVCGKPLTELAWAELERKIGGNDGTATRLKQYEDTGLEPEEVTAIKHALMGQEIAKIMEFDDIPVKHLIELAKAKKDGRLVVLPCKVGDTVYRVITTRDHDPIITEIKIKNLGQAVDLIGTIGEKQVFISWFRTREEAEAALKKREEADNEKGDSNRL